MQGEFWETSYVVCQLAPHLAAAIAFTATRTSRSLTISAALLAALILLPMALISRRMVALR